MSEGEFSAYKYLESVRRRRERAKDTREGIFFLVFLISITLVGWYTFITALF